MPIESSLRLLARNARKRLLIGVGIELLLKAVYLKNGYCINKPKSGSSPKFPFTEHEAAGALLADDYTFPLNTLIDSLPKVTSLQDKALTIKGLRDRQDIPKQGGSWRHRRPCLRRLELQGYRVVAR